MIPVPFSLGIIIICILAFLSKILFTQTFAPSFIISTGGILQILCWVVLLGILRSYYPTQNKINGLILIAVGIGITYILNFINLFLFFKYLMTDRVFSYWFRKQSSKINSRISVVLSVLFNHRYIHILFSRAFNSQSLSGCL